jgi:D-alanyl-D-alanine carboxypeptidase (penicillin-binding protein 5/6)
MQELDQNAPVVFSAFAKAAGEKESQVPAGEAFIRNNAIRFAIVESANDAAVALAEAIGRKRGAFSFDDAILLFKHAANQKARELGMVHSQFENSTGLDDVSHYTTAQDLFRLVSYVRESYPEIWDFSRAGEADISSLRGTVYHIAATNQLLSEFPALIGGKTGLTDAAKGTLILLYPVTLNHTAVIIVLGSDNRFEDGRMLIRWLEEAFNE